MKSDYTVGTLIGFRPMKLAGSWESYDLVILLKANQAIALETMPTWCAHNARFIYSNDIIFDPVFEGDYEQLEFVQT